VIGVKPHLLTKVAYLDMLRAAGKLAEVSPGDTSVARVLAYARRAWPEPMISFAFGDLEWLRDHEWQRMKV
jgi:hypothetical protein